MDYPTSDYANSYPDVFQSPDPSSEGGIYTLEEPSDRGSRVRQWQPLHISKDDSHLSEPHVFSRYAEGWPGDRWQPSRSGLRRPRAEWQGQGQWQNQQNREGFSARAYADGSLNEMPGSSTGLRSQRWDRPPLDEMMWDERPRAFRPNSSNLHAELFIPPSLRPAGATPYGWNLAYPNVSTSQATNTLNPEPFTGRPYDGGAQSAACPGLGREGCRSGGCDSCDGCGSDGCHHHHHLGAKLLKAGMQSAQLVLFFILVVLLALWIVMGGGRGREMKFCILDATVLKKSAT